MLSLAQRGLIGGFLGGLGMTAINIPPVSTSWYLVASKTHMSLLIPIPNRAPGP